MNGIDQTQLSIRLLKAERDITALDVRCRTDYKDIQNMLRELSTELAQFSMRITSDVQKIDKRITEILQPKKNGKHRNNGKH